MSLIGHVYLLSEPRIRHLLGEPSAVAGVIDGAYNDPAAGFVDLDKAWHCLHYLLTGSVRGGEPPLDFILAGGHAVGTEDLGRGPPRAFLPSEVSAIAGALGVLDVKQLMARFDLQKLERLQIYPGGWKELNLRSDYDLGYYFGPFEELKRVTQRAKEQQLGMLVWIA